MISWKNLDTLESWKKLEKSGKKVNLPKLLSGEAGGERVRNYAVNMGGGLKYYYGAKQVDEEILSGLAALAEEAQLIEKYQALYEGAVINTGEKRLVTPTQEEGSRPGPGPALGPPSRASRLVQATLRVGVHL